MNPPSGMVEGGPDQPEDKSNAARDDLDSPPGDAEGARTADDVARAKPQRRSSFSRALGYGVLPGLALLLAAAAGYLKWQDASIHASQVGGTESVAAAKEGTVAILS